MKYKKISTYSYNLHIIKTDKFKTVTVKMNFKRELDKKEISYRNMLINMLCESTAKYPTKRLMNIATEELYELCYRGMNYISGKYNSSVAIFISLLVGYLAVDSHNIFINIFLYVISFLSNSLLKFILTVTVLNLSVLIMCKL